MKDILLNVAKDFSDAPGGRYRKDGDYSGEEFYDNHLEPKFEEALEDRTTLVINLDNVWGFPVSFISESFGKLSTKYGKEKVKSHLKFIWHDEPLLIKEIETIIDDPNHRG